jgi:hypothetical protein
LRCSAENFWQQHVKPGAGNGLREVKWRYITDVMRDKRHPKVVFVVTLFTNAALRALEGDNSYFFWSTGP